MTPNEALRVSLGQYHTRLTRARSRAATERSRERRTIESYLRGEWFRDLRTKIVEAGDANQQSVAHRLPQFPHWSTAQQGVLREILVEWLTGTGIAPTITSDYLYLHLPEPGVP